MEQNIGQGASVMSIGIILWDFRGHGVARVVTDLLPVFSQMGVHVVVVTGGRPEDDLFELPPTVNRVCIGFGSDRQDNLRRALIKNNVKVVIDHEYFELERLQADIKTVRECGAKFVVHHHSVFTSALMLPERRGRYSDLMKMYPQVDGVITLSRVDECLFKSLGCRAFHIQNPVFSSAESKVVKNDSEKRLIWIGRIVPIKQLEESIELFRLVLKHCPNTKLYVVGDCDGAYAQGIVQAVRQDKDISGSVVFEGFQANVTDYLKNADVMLMTSLFDGWGCVFAEAYSVGIPVVCYDLPYSDAVRNRDGVVAVPQKDRQSAADAVVKLLTDQQYYHQMSAAARASYEQMLSYDLEKRYRQFFDYLETGVDPDGEPESEDYRIALRTLTEHAGATVDELMSKQYFKRRLYWAIRGRLSILLRPWIICKKIFGRMFPKRGLPR